MEHMRPGTVRQQDGRDTAVRDSLQAAGTWRGSAAGHPGRAETPPPRDGSSNA